MPAAIRRGSLEISSTPVNLLRMTDVNDTFTLITLNAQSLPACDCEMQLGGPEPLTLYGYINLIVIWFCMPAIALIGICTNIMSVIIYSHSSLNHRSSSRYLIGLSCSDCCVCVSGILVITGDSVRSRSETLNDAFVQTLPYTMPFMLTIQMVSVYITVNAAVDCFIDVWFARNRFGRGYCRPNVATAVLIVTSLFAFLYNVPVFFELRSSSCWDEGRQLAQMEVCPTQLLQNEQYFTYYKVYAYTLVMAVIPFSFLLVINALIVGHVMFEKKTKKPIRRASQRPPESSSDSESVTSLGGINVRLRELDNQVCHYGSTTVTAKLRSQSTPGQNKNSNSKDQNGTTANRTELLKATGRGGRYEKNSSNSLKPGDATAMPCARRANAKDMCMVRQLAMPTPEPSGEGSSTIMLVMVVALFLFCNSVSLAVVLLEILLPEEVFLKFNHYLIDCGNLLVVINSSANFFIYLKYSAEYRVLFKSLIVGHTRAQLNKTANNVRRISSIGLQHIRTGSHASRTSTSSAINSLNSAGPVVKSLGPAANITGGGVNRLAVPRSASGYGHAHPTAPPRNGHLVLRPRSATNDLPSIDPPPYPATSMSSNSPIPPVPPTTMRGTIVLKTPSHSSVGEESDNHAPSYADYPPIRINVNVRKRQRSAPLVQVDSDEDFDHFGEDPVQITCDLNLTMMPL